MHLLLNEQYIDSIMHGATVKVHCSCPAALRLFLYHIVLSSSLKITSPHCLLMVSLHVQEGSNVNGKGRRKLPWSIKILCWNLFTVVFNTQEKNICLEITFVSRVYCFCVMVFPLCAKPARCWDLEQVEVASAFKQKMYGVILVLFFRASYEGRSEINASYLFPWKLH